MRVLLLLSGERRLQLSSGQGMRGLDSLGSCMLLG